MDTDRARALLAIAAVAIAWILVEIRALRARLSDLERHLERNRR